MSEFGNLLAGAAELRSLFRPVTGRRALNIADKARHVWVSQGDGNNRASIRKEMSLLPREARLFNRAKMQHQVDLEALRQHPMAGGNEETTVRNALKALRKTR